jgi:hypothetical protein
MTGRTFDGLVSQPARRRTALLPSSPMLRRMGTKPGEASWRGRVAYGEAVWSWHPLLVSSPRRRGRTQPRGIRRRGERGVNRSNHCAGKAGLSRPNLWSLPPCTFFARGTAGAASTRSSLRPLSLRGARDGNTPGAIRAAGTPIHIGCLTFEKRNTWRSSDRQHDLARSMPLFDGRERFSGRCKREGFVHMRLHLA